MTVLKSSNMATTPGHLNSFVPTPKIFNVGDNIEEFLEEIQRFYELTGIQGPLQKTFIRAFLSADAAKLYEAIEDSIEDYKERFRKAFQEPADISKDLYAALKYRKGEETVAQFFKKIDILADNILRHTLTKETLVTFLLQNSIDDMDIKKEIKMRSATSNEDIKQIITKMELIKKELQAENNVAVLKTDKPSYARAVQSNQRYNNQPIRFKENIYYNGERREIQKPKQTQYFNSRAQNYSNKEAYQGRELSHRIKTCWACREKGHVRSQCPHVQCSHCKKPGHFRHQCYESRRKESYQRYKVAAFDDQVEYQDSELDSSEMVDKHPNAKALPREEVIGAIH